MDNSLNNTDFGIGVDDNQHRNVTLYEVAQSGTASLPITDGVIRVGSGRANGSETPPGGAGNTTFFDSIENKLQHDVNLEVVLPQDVVWWVSNGKSTAQFAFDDYLNQDSFIISKMNGALDWVENETRPTEMGYYDGWDERAEFNDVRVANDATALDIRWKIPSSGDVTGNGRIEPIAHGGIEGKGIWLGPNMGIEIYDRRQSAKKRCRHRMVCGNLRRQSVQQLHQRTESFYLP